MSELVEIKKRGRPIKYLLSEVERKDKKLMRKIYNKKVYLQYFQCINNFLWMGRHNSYSYLFPDLG